MLTVNDLRKLVVPATFGVLVIGCEELGNNGAGENAPPIIYDVTVDPEEDEVSVSVPVPHNNSTDGISLYSRAQLMNIAPQVTHVECDGARVIPSGKNVWKLPPACIRASWRVKPIPYDGRSAGPADQQTFAMKGAWWLISGPSSILRFDGVELGETYVKVGLLDGAMHTEPLPLLSKPPAFYVVGDAPSQEFKARSIRLRYIGNDLAAVTAYVEPDNHLQALAYFHRILRLEPSNKAPALQVVWFGVSQERHQMSGAAGANTLLANYLLPADNPKPEAFYSPFVLVLHEQFHQVQSRAPYAKAQPEWVGESLAQYYAVKSAREVFPDTNTIQTMYTEFAQTQVPIKTGLLEVQRQISNERNYANYSLFYSQGPRFWAAIDDAMAQSTEGRQSLDDVLPDILSVRFDAPDQIPEALKAALSAINNARLEDLFRTHLHGGPKE